MEHSRVSLGGSSTAPAIPPPQDSHNNISSPPQHHWVFLSAGEMTQAEIKLCSLLLQEHFGEIVEKIGTYLIRTGTQPLRMIVNDTGLVLDQVRLAPARAGFSLGAMGGFR